MRTGPRVEPCGTPLLIRKGLNIFVFGRTRSLSKIILQLSTRAGIIPSGVQYLHDEHMIHFIKYLWQKNTLIISFFHVDYPFFLSLDYPSVKFILLHTVIHILTITVAHIVAFHQLHSVQQPTSHPSSACVPQHLMPVLPGRCLSPSGCYICPDWMFNPGHPHQKMITLTTELYIKVLFTNLSQVICWIINLQIGQYDKHTSYIIHHIQYTYMLAGINLLLLILFTFISL